MCSCQCSVPAKINLPKDIPLAFLPWSMTSKYTSIGTPSLEFRSRNYRPHNALFFQTCLTFSWDFGTDPPRTNEIVLPSLIVHNTSTVGVNQRRSNSFSTGVTFFFTDFSSVPLSSTSRRPAPRSLLMSFLVFLLFTRNAVSDRLNSRAISCSHLSSFSYGK